jgi:uncharacterized SAM-binding protein YcdF (DUF218 family)
MSMGRMISTGWAREEGIIISPVSIPVISILVVLGVALARLGWRRSGYVALGLALALLIGLGCGPLTTLLLEDLQRDYPARVAPQPARVTAIVLLGNGTEEVETPREPAVEVGALAYGRIVKALELYQACKRLNTTCFVLISGGDPQRHGASEAAIYSLQLARLGVPLNDLVLEEHSLNTFQNARNTAPLLSARSPDQVFLVSSGLHLRRALLYFAHFGLHPRPVRADFVSAIPGLLPLSYNFLAADLALHEYEGVVRYFIYQLMGWNVPATRARSP